VLPEGVEGVSPDLTERFANEKGTEDPIGLDDDDDVGRVFMQ
jgi:hypothetical protein